MYAWIFNGFYTFGLEETVPFFTRIAVLVAICAVLYDFIRRKAAASVTDALARAEAVSEESAVTVQELEKQNKGIARKCSMMLRDTSPLRRLVLKTEKNGQAAYYVPPAEVCEEEGIDAIAKSARRMPASLRGGAERSGLKLAVGLVLLAIAGELFIRFFPVLYEHFIVNSKNLFQ